MNYNSMQHAMASDFWFSLVFRHFVASEGNGIRRRMAASGSAKIHNDAAAKSR